MNTLLTTGKAFLLSLCMFAVSTPVLKAQDGAIGELLEGGAQDAETYFGNYIAPAVKGFGYALNNGWYHTAKPHKTLGIDIMVRASLAMVPANQEFFTFNNSEYTQMQLSDNSDNQLPTIMGPAVEGPEITINDSDGQEVVRLGAPQGLGLRDEIGINAIPAPMLQLGLGIYKGTDVKIRFVPTLDLGEGDGTFSLFGIGVMHDVKQWIPGIKKLPFDLSGFIGYTSMRTTANLSDTDPDQKGIFEVNGLSFQGIISKKMSVLTVYSSLGFNNVFSNMQVLGEFELDDNTTLTAPIDLQFRASSPRLGFGMNLKLGPLVLTGDYTFNQFSMLSIGAGLSIR